MFTSDSKHKRSGSSLSNKRDCFTDIPPIPPPRSAPTTFRRPRRNIGDTIYIASSSSVYLNFKNDYLNQNYEQKRDQNHNQNKVQKNVKVKENDEEENAVSKFKNKVYEGYNRELQEINCFIGISCFLFCFIYNETS